MFCPIFCSCCFVSELSLGVVEFGMNLNCFVRILILDCYFLFLFFFLVGDCFWD